jgi:hypothetical protein
MIARDSGLGRLLLALALLAVAGPAGSAAGLAGLRVVATDMSVGLVVQLPDHAPYHAEPVPGAPGFAVVTAGPTTVTLLLPSADDPQDPAAASVALARVDIDLEADTFATLVVSYAAAAGAPPSIATYLDTLLVPDGVDTLPPGAHASLRIVHAAFGGETLGIDVRPRSNDDEAPPESTAVTLTPGSSSARVALPAGPYEVVLTSDGATPAISTPHRLDLRAGVAYTLVIAVEPEVSVAASAAGLRVVIDAVLPEAPHLSRPGARAAPLAADMAALQVVHLSPDAPPIDVLIDGRGVARDVPFIGRTQTVMVPAGRHEVRILPHRPPRAATGNGPLRGSAAVALESIATVLDLGPGTRTTVVLTGSYEPPPEEGGGGHLSLQVDPPDATLTLSGPRGFRAVLRGDQFLVGLEPGPYRAEVARDGYVAVTYEFELAPQTTSLVTITLQEEQVGDDATPQAGETLDRVDRAATWRGLELQPYADRGAPLAPPGQALVRLVHAAPTVAALDGVLVVTPEEQAAVAVDAAATAAAPPQVRALARSVGFPNRSDYVSVPAGDHLLELRLAGTDSVVHAIPAMPFLAGVTYTMFLSADPVTNEVWVLPVVEAVVPTLVPEGRR